MPSGCPPAVPRRLVAEVLYCAAAHLAEMCFLDGLSSEDFHSLLHLLQTEKSLYWGSVTVGAFDDAAVRNVLQLPESEAPFYLLPVGRQ
jgi:hypothetical protein